MECVVFGRVKSRILVAVSCAGAVSSFIAQAQPAAASVTYHTVQYSIEAEGGATTASVQYTADLRDHSDPTEKHLTQEEVELPWTVELQIGESDFSHAGAAPDSKPFKGLNIGMTATASGGMNLEDAMTDDQGKIRGPEAWDAWTGGQGRGSFYTCRITVDGEVVAEETMKSLCSAQYKKRV